MESQRKHWLHDDDFEQDLYEISEFCQSAPAPPVQNSIKPNAHVRKARGKPSIYEEPCNDDENIAPPKPSGRGSSLLWKEHLTSPGGVPSFLQRQKETAKEIRMASTNGFGYCNDHIEHMLNANSTKSDIGAMDNVKLSPSKCKLTRNGLTKVGDNPPPALYDIIKGNGSKPFANKTTTKDESLNINSYKDFPKL